MTDSDRSAVAGVVLAAGSSRRLGSPKQLLEFGSKSLLQHVVDAAEASHLGDITIVLGHEYERIQADLTVSRARIVVNLDYAAGQSTSLRRGIESLGPEATGAVVMLADQPTLSTFVIDALIAAFEEEGGAVVQPIYAGEIGHPVLLNRTLFPEVLSVTGDHGARDVVAAHRADRRLVRVAGTAPPDVDDIDDYQRLLAQNQDINP